jgi:hypothetical protein
MKYSTFQVNKGHPPQDEDIFLAPQFQGVIKPHQVLYSRLLKLFCDSIISVNLGYLSSTYYSHNFFSWEVAN